MPLRRELWSRVTSEGTREITTRRGRSFPVLVTSPRDGTTGPTVSWALLVTARSQSTKRFGYLIRGASGSDSTNHHVGVSGCSASYTSAGVVTTSAIERPVRIGLRMQLRLYKGLLGLLPNGLATCGVSGATAMTPGGIGLVRRARSSLAVSGRVASYCLAEGGHDLMVCPAGVKRAWWVTWCTPAGKKQSIDSLSYGNGHSELYPLRYN